MNKLLLFAVASLVLTGGGVEIRGQSAGLPLSSFSAGFGEQAVAGKRVMGQVGNTAVGRSSGSGKVVLSGFIPGAVRFRFGSTVQYAVQDKWNMVSIPLTLADYTKTAVYPNAVSNAFFFNGAYIAAPVLANGPGYWVKFDGAQSVALTGLPRDVDSITVTGGWNMVGSISSTVNVADITSDPPGIVTSDFFRFDNMYVSAATIEPGRGYWVKTTVSGKLILDATANAPTAGRIRIEDHGEMPPPPPGDDLAGVAPTEFALRQNYPNPFNPTTKIVYEVPVSVHVVLTLYDVLGREVVKIAEGAREPGRFEEVLDASALPGGVYFYRLRAGSFVQAGKLMLLK